MKNNKDRWHRSATTTWTTDCDNDGDDGDNGLRQTTTTTAMTTGEREWWWQWRWWQFGGGISACRCGCQPVGRGNRWRFSNPEGNHFPFRFPFRVSFRPPLSSFHVPPRGVPTDFRKIYCVSGTRPSLIIMVPSTNDRRAIRPSVCRCPNYHGVNKCCVHYRALP